MALYNGKTPEDLKKTNLFKEVSENINIEGFNVEGSRFNDGSGCYISLEKETDSEQIHISISFTPDGKTIDNIRAWKTPIKKVLVEDEEKLIM